MWAHPSAAWQGTHLELLQESRFLPGVWATDNKLYSRQCVVDFFCIAEVKGQKLAGEIVAEKRDDSGTKIVYDILLYPNVFSARHFNIFNCGIWMI